MKKYIDADRLKKAVEHELDMQDTYLPAHFFDIVDDMPAADVQEVKHGRWIKKYRGNYLCSVCGAWYRTKDDYGNIIDGEMTANYCESCGAKMYEVTERKCDTCVIAQTHNLEDDDSPCLDCEEKEDGDKS